MELREYTNFNQKEILSLYTSVGWENYTRSPQMLERAYENSFLKIAAFDGEQLIGMVRVVGDVHQSLGLKKADEIGCCAFLKM